MKFTLTLSTSNSKHFKMYEVINVVLAPLVLNGENTEFFYKGKN